MNLEKIMLMMQAILLDKFLIMHVFNLVLKMIQNQ